MANHIDCQLTVEGAPVCLEELKSRIIKVYGGYYNVDLKHLSNGREGVANVTLTNTMNHHHNFLPLNENFENFDFEFRDATTFYEWVKYIKFADASISVNEDWQQLIYTENKLIVKFTSAWTPPIIEIMLGSKLYPDLKFTLSYKDISEYEECGSIEGTNGKFSAINHEKYS